MAEFIMPTGMRRTTRDQTSVRLRGLQNYSICLHPGVWDAVVTARFGRRIDFLPPHLLAGLVL